MPLQVAIQFVQESADKLLTRNATEAERFVTARGDAIMAERLLARNPA